MERKIMSRLVQWKTKAERLPLLLYGARQVGKTFILNAFGKNYYDDLITLNFEQTPHLKLLFAEDLAPKKVIPLLEAYFHKSIKAESTLIFLDEIQACERALTALKYFSESAPEYHLIAAGSLLGVATARSDHSFPVGKVQLETLLPLDFEEFLWATNKKSLVETIRNSLKDLMPLPEILHREALSSFHDYVLCGGMPAVVLTHIQAGALPPIAEIQSDILNAYIADMAKYATPSETVKIRAAFDSIPAQLAKDNKKFQYKVIKKGASVSHFGSALDWLTASGIVNKCYRVTHAEIPLAAYQDLSAFKLYMADTGLLCQKAGITSDFFYSPYLEQNTFKGALIENYVAQALIVNHPELYYWESPSIAEVDFIIQEGAHLIPVEVKASDHVRSRSLRIYQEKYKPPYAIRLSTKNFGDQDSLRSIPLYAAGLI
jgi:hypothetical protein